MMLVMSSYRHDSRLRRQAEALVESGLSVEIICPNLDNSAPLEMDNGVKVRRLKQPIGNVRSKFSYILNYGLFFVMAFFTLTKRFFQTRAQAIVVHNMPNFLVFATIIPRLCRCKVTLDLHDLMPELYIALFKSNKGLGVWLLKLEEKLSCRFASQLMTANDLFAQTLQSRVGRPFYVVHNAPDPQWLSGNNRPHQDNGKTTLFHHGNIHHRSGIDRILTPLKDLVDNNKKVELVVHGKGPFYPEVQQKSDKMGLGEHCTFGAVFEADQLAGLMSTADIGLVPNRVGEFTTLCMPVKLLEYVECKLPVICSRMKTASFYFDDSMIYYFDDESEIAPLVEHIINNPKQARQKAEKAWQKYQQLCWAARKSDYVEYVRGG